MRRCVLRFAALNEAEAGISLMQSLTVTNPYEKCRVKRFGCCVSYCKIDKIYEKIWVMPYEDNQRFYSDLHMRRSNQNNVIRLNKEENRMWLNVLRWVIFGAYLIFNFATAMLYNVDEMKRNFIKGQCLIGMIFANIFYVPAWFLKAFRYAVLNIIA